MFELLNHLFGWVCGQNPDHTWMPGGTPLPCCQRCLGLYAGAGVAAGLQAWLRPGLSGRFLAWHGALLVLMAPFGFHWVSQGAVLRTMSGVWFGAAVVTFLRLAWAHQPDKALVYGAGTACPRYLKAAATGTSCPGPEMQPWPGGSARLYWCGLLAALLGIPAAAAGGGIAAAYLLTGLAAIGGAVLVGLTVVSAAALCRGLLGGREKA